MSKHVDNTDLQDTTNRKWPCRSRISTCIDPSSGLCTRSDPWESGCREWKPQRKVALAARRGASTGEFPKQPQAWRLWRKFGKNIQTERSKVSCRVSEFLSLKNLTGNIFKKQTKRRTSLGSQLRRMTSSPSQLLLDLRPVPCGHRNTWASWYAFHEKDKRTITPEEKA